MKAWVHERWGGPEVLRLADMGDMAADADSVVIRPEYAGINPADWKFLGGKYKIICRGGMPRCTGTEGAGVVSAAGANSGVPVGARVVYSFAPGNNRQGTYADCISVPAARVLQIPDSIASSAAACLPVAGLTAWMMCNMAGVTGGKRVLVSGASGGVGHFAVQIAKARGASVTALASARNHAQVMAWGASTVIDYRQTPPEALTGQWDAIIDCANVVGRNNAARLLAGKGRFVDTDPLPLTMLRDRIVNLAGGRYYNTVTVDFDAAGLRELFKLILAGQVQPLISEEFPFAQVPQALGVSLGGHAVGKFVIRF